MYKSNVFALGCGVSMLMGTFSLSAQSKAQLFDKSFWIQAKTNQITANSVAFQQRDRRGRTPLMVAAEAGASIEVVSILIEQGAELNVRDIDDKTVLMYAVTKDKNIELVRRLLSLGADVNASDYDHMTPLLYAGSIEPKCANRLRAYQSRRLCKCSKHRTTKRITHPRRRKQHTCHPSSAT